MRGKLLRFMSAFVAVPILVSSVFFAKDVQAASKTYADDSVTHYEITKTTNEGYYFEPSESGKYQAMIYFHGASSNTNVCDLGNLPDRLKNDMNKWIDMGYCNKMVVITPAITQKEAWGITEFREFVDNGHLAKLVEEIKSGTGIGAKVDTSLPIVVAGFSQGGSEALYAAAKYPDTFYNVGAFSASWCCYNGTNSAWLKNSSDLAFSKRTDGQFFISYGANEDAQFKANYDRYLYVTESNGQNIKNRFKSRVYSSEFGPHSWRVFELGTFDFLYYLKNGSVPDEEITVSAVWGKVTLSGTTTVGNTLSASCVSYYTSSFKYQWYRINASTGEATEISGATSASYTLTSADAGYKIRCKIKDKNGGVGYTYKTTGVISSAQQTSAITGTVTISGNEIRFGYKVTATVSGSNASNYKYQWKRGDSAISGATSNTYTFVQDDIGKQISCVVTDKDGKYTGSISSAKTAAVKKAYGPAAPAATGVDCSAVGAKDGKIQNVNTKMEYAVGSQDAAYTACAGTEITGLGKETYFVRYKETATTYAGAITIVSIKEKTPTTKQISNATISAIADQTYTGSAITPAVTVKDGSSTLVKDTDYTVSYSNNVNAGTATVTITGKGNYTGTKTANFKIVKPSDPVKTGWQNKGGKWYLYNESGKKVTGFADVEGKTYYMDANGVMQTRWVEVEGNWYYFNNSGVMQKGWQQIGGAWYYLDRSNGAMATGWLDDGGWYYLSDSGAMLTGWQEIGGKWYYLASTGVMQTGWIKSGDAWYYLGSSGAMMTGWQKIDGDWYYLTSSGAMATKWQEIGGKWYWLGTNGVMVYSTSIEYGGKTYNFDKDGVCTNP